MQSNYRWIKIFHHALSRELDEATFEIFLRSWEATQPLTPDEFWHVLAKEICQVVSLGSEIVGGVSSVLLARLTLSPNHGIAIDMPLGEKLLQLHCSVRIVA